MDCSGVDHLRIIAMFGLSFWRHPFTANDQLVYKWCNATFLQICSDDETKSSTWPEFEYIFSKLSFFDELFLLTKQNKTLVLYINMPVVKETLPSEAKIELKQRLPNWMWLS